MRSVAENFRALQGAIAKAGGRDVRIAGAAKDQPVERVREASEAGLRIVAMNYVQQGEALRSALGALPVEWHFIGHIQSRKARSLLDYDCVQSLDRISVAQDLNARLAVRGKVLPVLVEVNIGEEPQKSGISPMELPSFLEALKEFTFLRPVGLMGMPPPIKPVEARRPFFRKLRQLFESAPSELGFHILSMGTSDDFLVAVEEGATLVRLGTILFGARERH